MIFNSLSFILFFAILLAAHYSPLPWRAKKVNLLIASYLFYGAWNPPFVLLLWVSTLIDFNAARAIAKSRTQAGRKLWLFVSLLSNLGLLAYFKYGGFLLENFVALVNSMGIEYNPVAPSIILPVGISFYTFQTLSYTIDVYRNELKSDWNFLDFALYVTFFPQLVAGPIVRARDFLPQLLTPRLATSAQMGWGISLLTIGLFQKVFIADTLLAPVADRVYANAADAGLISSWIGAFAFSGQIFCDFAGYSTCAIGVAMCLGFTLPKNFDYPYAAIGFSDFWRRWHISLSTWLRDYLYIPLGGNKVSTERTYANLMLTMLIGGLWHGAAWRFIAWGGLHGSYLVAERLLRGWAKRRAAVRHTDEVVDPRDNLPALAGASGERGFLLISNRIATLLAPLSLAFLTYLLVCVTWVFFRAQSFLDAAHIIKAMFGMSIEKLHLGKDVAIVSLITVLMLAVHWTFRDSSLERVVERIPWWMRSLILSVMMFFLALYLVRGDERAFIYFQF